MGAKEVPVELIRLVQQHRVEYSAKAQRQREQWPYSIDDLYHSIIHVILHKKERDETGKAKYKYTIIGPSLAGYPIYSCGKIITLRGKRYFVLTFHERR